MTASKKAADWPRLGTHLKWVVPAGILLLGVGLLFCWTSSARKTFAWFNTLGFPDVAGCKLVRIYDPAQSTSGLLGFLLSQSNDTFTVLTMDLFVHSFRRTPSEMRAVRQVYFVEMDWEEDLEAALKEESDGSFWDEHLSECARLFVLAWASQRNGRSHLARRFFSQASNVRYNIAEDDTVWERWKKAFERLFNHDPRPPTMIEQLQIDLGPAMTRRALQAFGDPQVTREQLLAQLEAVVKNYPLSPRLDEAVNWCERLKRW